MKVYMEKLSKNKYVFLIVTILFIICLLTFSRFRTKTFFLQSKTIFDVVYQPQTTQFSQYPFWIITNEELNYKSDDYIIGDNVKIFGENVDVLNGSKLIIVEHDLTEIVDNNDDFYRKILRISESYKDEVSTYSKQHGDSGDTEEIEISNSKIVSAKILLEPYIASGRIIQMNLLVNKLIEDDVVVERIEIGDLVFNFDYFKITVADYMYSNSLRVDDYIDIISYGGYSEYSFNPCSIYYEVALKSKSDIDHLEIYNISGDTEFDEFRNASEKNQKTDIPKGKEGIIPVEFQFNSTHYPERLADFDVMATSVLIDLTLKNNEKFSINDLAFEGREMELIMYRLYNELVDEEM